MTKPDPKPKRCLRCGKLLDVPGLPSSIDCGGDCAECVAEAEAMDDDLIPGMREDYGEED